MNKEVYDSILELFTGNDTFRSWADTPFTIGENVFATNFNAMAIIDKNKVSDFAAYTGIKSENITNKIPIEENKSFSIDVLAVKKAFELVPKEECTDTFGQDVKCIECDGDGEVDWEYRHYTQQFECPICKGEGLTDHSYKKPNGKFQMKGHYYLDVFDSRFSTVLFSKVIEAADKLNIKQIELIHQIDAASASLFRVLDVKILVMPIYKDDDQSDNVILALK